MILKKSHHKILSFKKVTSDFRPMSFFFRERGQTFKTCLRVKCDQVIRNSDLCNSLRIEFAENPIQVTFWGLNP